MPWETRDGKGRYFTVTINRKHKPVRIYFGRAGSPPAELASVIVELRRLDPVLLERYWQAYDRRYFAAKEAAAVDAMCQFFRSPWFDASPPVPKAGDDGSEEGPSPMVDKTKHDG